MENNKSAIAFQNHSDGGSRVVQILNESSTPNIKVEVIIESEDENDVEADWSIENRDIDEMDSSTQNILADDQNHEYDVNDRANDMGIPENCQSFEQGNIITEVNNFSNEGSQDSGIKIEFLNEEDCDVEMCIKKEIIEVEENELLQCKICMAIFKDKNQLSAHNEQKHSEAEVVLFGCNVCSATFSEEPDMKEHIRVMHGNLRSFQEITKPQVHRLINGLEINKKHENEEFQNVQVYQHLIQLDKNNKKKSKKSNFHIYKCKVCLNFVGLTANRAKEDVDDFMCRKCKEKILQRCTICDKVYKSKSYKVHMEEVHGGGSFPCSECNEVFKCKRYMQKHTKIVHQGGRRVRAVPSECNICFKVFKDADSLGQHKKNCHSQSVICSICFTELSSTTYLRTHMRRVHKDLNCSKCLKRFCTKSYLKRHTLTCTEKVEDSNKPF